jgi:hypothetical protein
MHENIRVDRDYQWRPAQPSAAISAISSIVSGVVTGRYRQPMKLPIDAPDLAARTNRRPFGSRPISTFWPRVTPGCLNTSLPSVTYPFAVPKVVPMDVSTRRLCETSSTRLGHLPGTSGAQRARSQRSDDPNRQNGYNRRPVPSKRKKTRPINDTEKRYRKTMPTESPFNPDWARTCEMARLGALGA